MKQNSNFFLINPITNKENCLIKIVTKISKILAINLKNLLYYFNQSKGKIFRNIIENPEQLCNNIA